MNYFFFSLGTGKSKQIGKNIAASYMLKILSESPSQADAQQQSPQHSSD